VPNTADVIRNNHRVITDDTGVLEVTAESCLVLSAFLEVTAELCLTLSAF
jgi:hypothetical protein